MIQVWTEQEEAVLRFLHQFAKPHNSNLYVFRERDDLLFLLHEVLRLPYEQIEAALDGLEQKKKLKPGIGKRGHYYKLL